MMTEITNVNEITSVDQITTEAKTIRPRITDEQFVICWTRNAGDVRKIAEELDRTEQSIRSRGQKYIKAGVNLCEIKRSKKPRIKLIDNVPNLNSLLDTLRKENV